MAMTQPMAGNAPGAEPLDKKAAKAAKKAAKAAEKGGGKGKKKSKKKLIIGAVLLLVVVKFVVLKPKAVVLNCPEGMAWAQKYVGQPEEHAAPAPAAAPAEAAGHGKDAAPEGEGGDKSDKSHKSAEKPKPDPCAPVPGAVYNAEEAVTLNLADGRFAKFKIALQLTSKASLEEFTADEKGAKGKHVAINVLGTKSYQDMQPPRLLEVEKELAQAVAAVYEGEVMNVYFIDLVKQ